MLPITDLFAGAATRTGRGLASTLILASALISAAAASAAAAPPPAGLAAVDSARLKAADSEPQNWFTGGRDQDGSYYSPLTDIDAGNVEAAGICLELRSRRTRSAARRRRRSSSTGSCTPPAPGATCMRSMPRRAGSCGATTRRPTASPREIPAAIWSIAAWRSGRARSMSPRSMAGCTRSMRATGTQLWDGRHHRRSQAALLEHRSAADCWRSGGHRQRRVGHGSRRRARLRLGLRSGERRSSSGASSQCRRHAGSRSRTRSSRPRPRPGIRQRDPQFKGGGTAWDGFAYDPELKLVYFGTANAAPYDLRQLGATPGSMDSTPPRSSRCTPTPGGWPGTTRPRRNDHWDFDAVQKMILADLQHRRRRPASADAGQQERLLLRARSRDRRSCSRPRTTPMSIGLRGVDLKTGRPRADAAVRLVRGAQECLSLLVGRHIPGIRCPTAARRISCTSRSSMRRASGSTCAHNGGSVKFIDGFFTTNGIFARRHLRCGGPEAAVRAAAGPQGSSRPSARCKLVRELHPRLGSGRAENRLGA